MLRKGRGAAAQSNPIQSNKVTSNSGRTSVLLPIILHVLLKVEHDSIDIRHDIIHPLQKLEIDQRKKERKNERKKKMEEKEGEKDERGSKKLEGEGGRSREEKADRR